MNFYDEERIQGMRQQKLIEQEGRCAACGEPFKSGDKMELAHIIPQRLWIVKMYGKEIIHHSMNLKVTHSGNCNSAVQISPNKSELMMKHVQAIEAKIEEDTMQNVWDRR